MVGVQNIKIFLLTFADIELRSRALSFHLFVASALLLRESQRSQDGRSHEYEEAIEASIVLLEQIRLDNELARHAARILRENMPVTL